MKFSRFLFIAIILSFFACSKQNQVVLPEFQFEISQSSDSVSIPIGRSESIALYLHYHNKINTKVTLSCQDNPPGIQCRFDSNPVNINGTDSNAILIDFITSQDIAPGRYIINIKATDGRSANWINININVLSFEIWHCSPSVLAIPQGNNAQIQCFVNTYNSSFNSPIYFTCDDSIPGIQCSIQPEVITLPPGSETNIKISLKAVNIEQAFYQYKITARSNNLVNNYPLSVHIISADASLSIECKKSWKLAYEGDVDRCTISAHSFCGKVNFDCDILGADCDAVTCYKFKEINLCNEQKEISLTVWYDDCSCEVLKGSYGLSIRIYSSKAAMESTFHGTIKATEDLYTDICL